MKRKGSLREWHERPVGEGAGQGEWGGQAGPSARMLEGGNEGRGRSGDGKKVGEGAGG